MAPDIEALYQRYGPMVLRRCRQLLSSEEHAVEAMQDVFVELLKRRDVLEVDAPASLLYRMATNVCLNRIRSTRRRPETPDQDLLMRIAAAPDAEARSIAEAFLEKVFAKEAPSTKTIAVLHLRDGMTLEEVADEVGMSVSGVRKRLRTLREHVQELEGI